jgi:hypothetical protein
MPRSRTTAVFDLCGKASPSSIWAVSYQTCLPSFLENVVRLIVPDGRQSRWRQQTTATGADLCGLVRTVGCAEVDLAVTFAMDRCLEDTTPLADLAPQLAVVDWRQLGRIPSNPSGLVRNVKDTVLAKDGDSPIPLGLGEAHLARDFTLATLTPVLL